MSKPENTTLSKTLARIKATAARRIQRRTIKPKLGVLAGIAQTGDVEVDSKVELSATLKAFKEQQKFVTGIKRQTTDSEFWVAICFQTREQKEAFIAAKGWIDVGDKYLDGLEIAKRESVALPSAQNHFVLERATMKGVPRISKGGE